MSWFLNLFPEGMRVFVRHTVVIVALVVVGLAIYYVAKLLLKRAVRSRRIPEPVAVVVRLLVRWSIIAAVVVFALQDLGLAQGAWALLSAVIAAVAIGFFAVWSTLANFMSTLLLLVFRPFKVGDEVELLPDNIKGKVIDLTFMFTSLRGADGRIYQVPNLFFFQKIVACRPGTLAMELDEQLVRPEPTEVAEEEA